MLLTDVKIKNAKPAVKAYKLYDERGLFLIVTPKGGKWWRFKYRFDDKWFASTILSGRRQLSWPVKRDVVNPSYPSIFHWPRPVPT